MTPIRAAKSATRSVISGDSTTAAQLSSTGAVYDGHAPQEAIAPYVVFIHIPGNPVLGFGTDPEDVIETDIDLLVRATVEGQDSDPADSIMESVLLAMKTMRNYAYGGYTLDAIPTIPYSDQPYVNSKHYRQVGYRFTIKVRPNP